MQSKFHQVKGKEFVQYVGNAISANFNKRGLDCHSHFIKSIKHHALRWQYFLYHLSLRRIHHALRKILAIAKKLSVAAAVVTGADFSCRGV
jgi:hypothetical protein